MSNERSPLESLIRKCQMTKGLKTQILNYLVHKGYKANWAQISGWLHPDSGKRVAPSFHIGLALMRAEREVKVVKKPKPTPKEVVAA